MAPQLGDSFDDDEWRRFRQRCTRARFGAGAYIFHAGEAGDSLHIVESGRVAVLASAGFDEPITFTILGPGDVFGELALLGTDHHRSATVQAITATETMVMNRSDFEQIRRVSLAANDFFIQLLANQVVRLSNRLTETSLPVSERIYRRLIDVAVVFGVNGTDAPIPVTQGQLASLACAKLRVTNTVLTRAKRDGVLDLARRRIVVHDWAEAHRRARLRMS
jgi:CRP-like cAMP-binding protein